MTVRVFKLDKLDTAGLWLHVVYADDCVTDCIVSLPGEVPVCHRLYCLPARRGARLWGLSMP